MPKDHNYQRYNDILGFISTPKTSKEIATHFGWHDRNTRSHLGRLIESGLAIIVKVGTKPMQYQALADHVSQGGIVKQVSEKTLNRVILKKTVAEELKWSPNMIVQPNKNKRLIKLHEQSDALRRQEHKAPKVYIGSTMGMF
jgi:hypothetical protein